MVFDVSAITYHGEQWYIAKGGIPAAQYIDSAYARTPERAIAMLMQKIAAYLLKSGVRFMEPPTLPTGMTCEAMDFTFEELTFEG